jgi:predicted nuclease of predicted toxin-antitoxin system
MKYKFIVDANLSWRLTNWLREQGHDAQHVHALKSERESDTTIWDYARAIGAVVISKDEDFANRYILGALPKLIWVRWGNTRGPETIRRFESNWNDILESLDADEGFIELID